MQLSLKTLAILNFALSTCRWTHNFGTLTRTLSKPARRPALLSGHGARLLGYVSDFSMRLRWPYVSLLGNLAFSVSLLRPVS